MLEIKPPRLFVLASMLALITALSPSLGYCRGPAISVQGTALVPLRAVFDSLGATTAYNKGTITATRGGTSVSLTIGSKRAKRNGAATQLAVAPRLLGTQTYVPLRFVGEAFGATVGYDAGSGLVTVSGGQTAVELYVISPAVALACDAYSAFRSRGEPMIPMSASHVAEIGRHYPDWDMDMDWRIRDRMEHDARFITMLRRYGGTQGAAWSRFRVEPVDAHGVEVSFAEEMGNCVLIGTYGGSENPRISSITEVLDGEGERHAWSARVVNGQWRFTKTATYSS